MSAPATAVYPGSFDPLHLGHLEIASRARQIFPRVIVAVLENTDKQPLLPVAQRVELLRASLDGAPGIEVVSFSGLLVDFMREADARVIVRGIRAVSDFEYEFQLSLMNRRLWDQAETVYLTPKEEFFFMSSRMIKEVWLLGGDIAGLVPEPVRRALEARRAERAAR
jgi:pantetheine-phosphate adenylyltransferase